MPALTSKILGTEIQLRFAAVKGRPAASRPGFDVFEWDVWKMQWVRYRIGTANVWDLPEAIRVARRRNAEIEAMLERNSGVPEPMR